MNPKLMIWISVVLSALAQIFLKRGFDQLRSTGRKHGPGKLGTARHSLAWFGRNLSGCGESVSWWPWRCGSRVCRN